KELVGHGAHVVSTRQAYEGLRVAQALLTGDIARAGEETVRLSEHMAAHAGVAQLLSAALNPVTIGLAAAAARPIVTGFSAAERSCATPAWAAMCSLSRTVSSPARAMSPVSKACATRKPS